MQMKIQSQLSLTAFSVQRMSVVITIPLFADVEAKIVISFIYLKILQLK